MNHLGNIKSFLSLFLMILCLLYIGCGQVDSSSEKIINTKLEMSEINEDDVSGYIENDFITIDANGTVINIRGFESYLSRGDVTHQELRRMYLNNEKFFDFDPPAKFKAEYSTPIIVNLSQSAGTDFKNRCDFYDYQEIEPGYEDVLSYLFNNSSCGEKSIKFCIKMASITQEENSVESTEGDVYLETPGIWIKVNRKELANSLDANNAYTYVETPALSFDIPCEDETFQDNSISIADGKDSTEKTTELVNISASSAVTKIYLTNNPDCKEGGQWETITSENKQWQLHFENNASTVYAKFIDIFGLESACVSDSIDSVIDFVPDVTAPSVPSLIDDGSYTASLNVSPTITWTESTDTESGVSYYELSIGNSIGDDSIKSWVNVGKVTSASISDLDLTFGKTYYVNVRAVDFAGNISDFSSSDGFVYHYCNSLGLAGSWILIPGDSDYGTSDFCIMKFEAKYNLGTPVSLSIGAPWIYISQEESKDACESLGTGFHLVTNPEWMTVAANIASLDSNWSGEMVGLGELARGHSDESPYQICAADPSDSNSFVEGSCKGLSAGLFNQRRTNDLSNGSIIWDFSGNAWEWLDYLNSSDKPTGGSEYTTVFGTTTTPLSFLIPTNSVKSFWDDNWNSTQSIGLFKAGSPG